MPSKLRKAIGAVKDQTSISLAKVYTNNSSRSCLEVVTLKATRHDDAPINERYVKEILSQITSSKAQAVSCAHIIARRIGRTRNWIVALKSLMLVLRIFQDGDPYFPREILHIMKQGGKVLNLSSFRDDSHSSPWDYTAFVRTFALYLDERLNCFLTGKLQRRFSNKNKQLNGLQRSPSGTHPVREMKPTMLLDKISFWQKLLDRAVATRPTGSAKTNKLIYISLYAIVQESFDHYRDISDGLALLLDSFFHLQYQSCIDAFQCCVKASKQFEELCSFYELCKSLGVGRISEYPSVQKISSELIETLQEFLKDQASFPSQGISPPRLLLPAPPANDLASSSESNDASERHLEPTERSSGMSSYRTSLEDLMSVTEMGTGTSSCTSTDGYSDKKSPSPSPSLPLSTSNSLADIVSLQNWPPEDQELEQEQRNSTTGWELALVETAASQPAEASSNNLANSTFFNQESYHYNPFLQDTIELPTISTATIDQRVHPIDDSLPVAPTFQAAAAPTFSVQNPDGAWVAFPTQDDPFAVKKTSIHEYKDQQIFLEEQQLWLQIQDKIIAKNIMC